MYPPNRPTWSPPSTDPPGPPPPPSPSQKPPPPPHQGASGQQLVGGGVVGVQTRGVAPSVGGINCRCDNATTACWLASPDQQSEGTQFGRHQNGKWHATEQLMILKNSQALAYPTANSDSFRGPCSSHLGIITDVTSDLRLQSPNAPSAAYAPRASAVYGTGTTAPWTPRVHAAADAAGAQPHRRYLSRHVLP